MKMTLWPTARLRSSSSSATSPHRWAFPQGCPSHAVHSHHSYPCGTVQGENVPPARSVTGGPRLRKATHESIPKVRGLHVSIFPADFIG